MSIIDVLLVHLNLIQFQSSRYHVLGLVFLHIKMMLFLGFTVQTAV